MKKYYYKNQDGIITDITPVSYYSYNSSSKETLILLTLLLALLIQTVALYTIFCLGFKKNSDNKLEFGDRMSVIDFLTVAPLILLTR
jgi:hypothetical protein